MWACLPTNETDGAAVLNLYAEILWQRGRDEHRSSAYPDPFTVELDIRLLRETVHTTYGIVKQEPQDAETVLRLLKEAGQDPCLVSGENGQFFIRCVKA